MNEKKIKSNRLELLDAIRGITIISMIIFHTLWDLVYIYNIDIDWYKGSYGYLWQQGICWTFILLSGFCFSLGKNPLRRGVLVSLGGIAVTLATLIFMPENRVVFGILTLIGACMLIMVPLKNLLNRVNCFLGFIISFALFIIFRNVNSGYLGFEKLQFFKLPLFLYRNYFTAFLGFTPRSFYSGDYFSLFPWLFLFITGFFIYKICEKYSLAERLFSRGKIAPINFIGRHSLIIYLLHQPIIYGVLYIIM